MYMQSIIFPMSKWHLYQESKKGEKRRGPYAVWMVFGLIGVFILLLACINFMNLSTARSEKRAKEVGIRKAIGSVKKHLINQFFSESVLYRSSFLSFVFSILLVASWRCRGSMSFQQNKWSSPGRFPTLLAFISIGFLFFSYRYCLQEATPPSFLSSFQPVKVLKGTFRAGRLASLPRKVLVVMQIYRVCGPYHLHYHRVPADPVRQKPACRL